MSRVRRIRTQGWGFRFGGIVCGAFAVAAFAAEASADTWVSIGRDRGISIRRSGGHRPGFGARRSRLIFEGYRRGIRSNRGHRAHHRRYEVPYVRVGRRGGRRCDSRVSTGYYVADRCDRHWPRDCSCRRVWTRPRYYDRCEDAVIVRPRPRRHVHVGQGFRGWDILKRSWIGEPRPHLRRHGGRGLHVRSHRDGGRRGQGWGRRSRH